MSLTAVIATFAILVGAVVSAFGFFVWICRLHSEDEADKIKCECGKPIPRKQATSLFDVVATVDPFLEPTCTHTQTVKQSPKQIGVPMTDLKQTHSVVMYKSRGGWRYKMVAANGNVIFRSSEGYVNQDDAVRALDNACKAWVAETAKITTKA